MSELEKAKFSSAEILAKCIELVTDRFSTREQRKIAVESAYEIGVAEGRLNGVNEMGGMIDEISSKLKSA